MRPPVAPPVSADGIVDVLTAPRALAFAPPLMTVAGPHAEPVQVRIEIVGTVPPLARSYVTSLSPAVRSGVSGVTPLPLSAQFVVVAVGSQKSWFSSKSMFVVPDGFWTRDQNSSRNLSPAEPVSVKTPNAFRSLLFGGIEPVTMVGLALSSDVPWPKASSLAPLGTSFFATTPDRKALPVPPASQSMQGLALSTFRLASTSISKLLPLRTFEVVQLVTAELATVWGRAAADTAKTVTSSTAPMSATTG